MPEEALERGVEEADNYITHEEIGEEWWLIFSDPQLADLIETAIEQNPSLQTAEMRIEGAFAMASLERSSLFPYISYGADVSRQKLSTTGVIPFTTGPNSPAILAPVVPQIPIYFTLYETELNLNYHFDFWKKNRNQLEAALGRAQAEMAEFANAKLSISIAVAKAYFDWQIDDERIRNLEKLVENRRRYFELIQQRVEGHVDTELSLQVAEFNLIDSTDQLLQMVREREISQYELMALLGGEFTEQISSITQAPLKQIPVPSDLPLHLIAKRPDITAQIWLIESADREVDVARAGFYPDFNLSSFFGFQTIHLPKLLQWPSSYFNVDPAMTLPIFDGGKLAANLDISQVNYNLAILHYNELVVEAAKEVLEALFVLRNSWERFSEYEKKWLYQQQYLELIELKAMNNIGSGLDLLVSEGDALITEDQRLIAKGRTLRAQLDLIHAIGGGYDSCRE